MTVIRDAGGLVGGGLRQFMALTAVSLLWVSVMAARAGADRLERVRVSKDQRGFDLVNTLDLHRPADLLILTLHLMPGSVPVSPMKLHE